MNSLKNIGKLLILAVIIIVCVYVLFFSKFKVVENFTLSDCKNCNVKPTSSKCIAIKDLKVNDFGSEIANMRAEVIDTSYVFCPWEEKCSNALDDSYVGTLETQEERLKYSNEELNRRKGGKKIKCCPDETFYNSHTLNFSEIKHNEKNMSICKNIDTLMRQNRDIIDPEQLGVGTGDYYKVRNFCNFLNNTKLPENNSNYTDMSGFYFNRKVKEEAHILTNPNLTVEEILNYENTLELKGLEEIKQYLPPPTCEIINDNVKVICDGVEVDEWIDTDEPLTINNLTEKKKAFEESLSYDEKLKLDELWEIFKMEPDIAEVYNKYIELERKKSTGEDYNKEELRNLYNQWSQITIAFLQPEISKFNCNREASVGSMFDKCGADMLLIKRRINELNKELKELNLNTLTHKDRKLEIQIELSKYFRGQIETKYNYEVLDKDINPISSDFILNDNQFFDCFGNKKIFDTEQKEFSADQKKLFEENNYFGVDREAKYTTMQDNTQRQYLSRQDLDMELKAIESATKDTNNNSYTVTNQYLQAINRFYDKQMHNMIGPKTHAVNKNIQFDNGDENLNRNTFFVYNSSSNNEYECQDSVTNSKDFKYCGPPAYYDEHAVI